MSGTGSIYPDTQLPNPLDPLAPEGDLPQEAVPSGPDPSDLNTQPAPLAEITRQAILPQRAKVAIVLGGPQSARVEVDSRARHLVFENLMDPATGLGGDDMAVTFYQVTGNPIILRFKDSLVLDDLFLPTPVINFALTAGGVNSCVFVTWW